MELVKSLNNIYITLNQLEIRATPSNSRLLTGVYNELESLIHNLQQIGGEENVEREGE